MTQKCRGCGSFNYEYGFHFTDNRGCQGIMYDRCMAGIIGYHQNGDGDRRDECGRTFPPGAVEHYLYYGEHKALCRGCYMRLLTRR